MNTDNFQAEDIVRDPRVYLAAERTFLAWIRTGLALMGFGFVVARFSLLSTVSSIGFSTLVGIALILFGVIVNAASTVRYMSMIRRLEQGDILNRPSKLAISLSLGLAVIGCLVGAYLLLFP